MDADVVDPNELEDQLAQLIICHDQQGAGVDDLWWEFGYMTMQQCAALAAQIGTIAQVTHQGPHEERVTNILEAWASPHYRVWILPKSRIHPAMEYVDNQIIAAKEDPR